MSIHICIVLIGFRNRLDPMQAEELKNLASLVPRMVQTLEKVEKTKKKEKQRDLRRTVKSSRQRPDVGAKDGFSKFGEDAETDALSEDTMIDKSEIQDKDDEKQVKFAENDDGNSVFSFEPHER